MEDKADSESEAKIDLPVRTSLSGTPAVLAMSSTPVSSVLASVRRRSSTRSIKRKKFDDEVVESSLTPSQPKIEKIIKTKGGSSDTKPVTTVTTTTVPSTSPPATSSIITTTPTTASAVPTTPSPVTVATPMETTPPSVTKTTVATTASAPVTSDEVQTPTSVTLKATPLTISVPALEKAAAELEASQTERVSPVSMTTVTPTTPAAAEAVVVTTPLAPVTVTMATVTTVAAPPVPVTVEKRKSGKHNSGKRSSKKTSKPPPAASNKDLGRWKPQDDILLITAVQQTCDLTAVYLGCKFSCKFTLREIQERWYALLYDPILSKLAIQAMSQLHPDTVSQVESKALFSKEEESLLGTISSNQFQNSQTELQTFQDMLNHHPTVFHPSRTAKCLQAHWLLMRQYHLLPDQTVQPMPKGDHVLNFSDAEDMINDDDLRNERDEDLEHELTVADRRQKKEIRHLENELPKWQVLVDSVTGINPQEFDNQTLAVLRGRLVRYLMRSKEITLGRCTHDNTVDIDFSLEGPAWKISRKQGAIKMKNSGDFYIANEGKRPIYIDGKPIMKGSKQKLSHNSVVELSCLRFIFLINQDLISVLKQEAQKLPT